MERRTAIQILHEGAIFSISKAREKRLTDAMHTYAQEVMKWVSENCTYNSEIMMWGYKDDLYNYEQLIELFTQQNQK